MRTDDPRAFTVHLEAGITAAVDAPPPSGVHDWRPGGRMFRCRCGAERVARVATRGGLRGTTVYEHYVGGRRVRTLPGCGA